MKRKKLFYEARLIHYSGHDPGRPLNIAGGTNANNAAQGTPANAAQGPSAAPAVDADTAKRTKRLDTLNTFDKAREDFRGKLKNVDHMRQQKNINALRWSVSSAANVEAIFKDWDALRLNIDNKFYKNIKKQLLRPFSDANIQNRKTEDNIPGNIDYYTNPTLKEHADWLRAHDTAYWEAFTFFTDVQKMLTDQLKSHEGIGKLKADIDSDPVFKQITDHVSRAGKDFKKAFKERDYASLALYGVGVWALFKVAKKFKDASGGKYFDYLTYAAAAYAGYHILDRAGTNIGEKLGLKDKSSDVEGTILAHLMDSRVEGSGALDAAMLLALSDVKVKYVYEEYKRAGDSSFIHPDLFPDSFGKLVNSRPIDIRNPKSASERLYVATGKKLFATMHGLVIMYNQIPDQKETFEEAFCKGDEVTFETLSVYYSNFFTKYPEKSWLKRKDAFDATKAELDVLRDKNIPFNLDEPIGGGVKGMLYGFPVVFIRSADGKSYNIKTVDGHKKHAAAFASIPLEKGPTQDTAILKIKDKIKANMMRLITPLAIDGGVPDLQFDSSTENWTAVITNSGSEEFGIAGKKTTAYFYALPNGQGLEVKMGAMRMPLNWAIERAHPYKAPLITEVVQQNDQYNNLLLPFIRTGKLRLDDPTKNDGKFNLYVGSIKELVNYPLEVECKIERDAKGKITKKEYIISEESVEKLLGRKAFADVYAEALNQSPEVDLVFNRFESILSNAPESFVWHFLKSVPGWFSGATSASLTRGLSLSNFTGSIADEQAKALVRSRRTMMKNRISGEIGSATTLAQLENIRHHHYDPMLIELDILSNDFSRENLEKLRAGEDWSAVDFDRKIFRRLNNLGTKTEYYRSLSKSFQADVYGILYGSDDLRKQGHVIASGMLAVFSSYTSGLDDNSLTEDTPEAKQKREYIQVVSRKMIEVAQRNRKKEQLKVKVPYNREFWEIPTFEDYKKNPGTYAGLLDIKDTRPRMPLSDETHLSFQKYKELSDLKTNLEAKKTAGTTLSKPEEKQLKEAISELEKPIIFREGKLPDLSAMSDPDKAKFKKDILYPAIERRTELEKLFEKKFNQQMDYIYREAYKAEKGPKFSRFQSLKRRVLHPSIQFKYHGTKRIIKYPPENETDLDILVEDDVTNDRFVKAQMWGEISQLEELFKENTVLTYGDQEKMIDRRVRAIIEAHLFTKFEKGKYFDDRGTWQKIKDWWGKKWVDY